MPSQTDALANIYARSLFDLAKQAGGADKIAEVGQELEQIGELMAGDRALAEFFSSPIIDGKSRAQSINRMFGNRVTDLTLRFLLVLNDKGRLGKFQSIATAYDHLVQEAYGRIEVDVYTAEPLDGSQLATIRERVGRALGKEAVLHPYTEPSMLGGLKLRIGDQLIDGSVASRMRRMKTALLTEGASKLRDRITRLIEDR